MKKLAPSLFAALLLLTHGSAALAGSDVVMFQVAAGPNHMCAIFDGAAFCQGGNEYGQLGNGTLAKSSTWVPVVGLTSGVTAIDAGRNHACAIHYGAAKCWGQNRFGFLGNGTTVDSTIPVEVEGLNYGVTAISRGCAVQDGAALCWGRNVNGRLGDGTMGDSFGDYETKPSPVPVHGLESGVTGISSGADFSCAIQRGSAKCWGHNFAGQLGDGTTTDIAIPTQVIGLTEGVTALSAGTHHACAVQYGAVKCWGANRGGNLGNGKSATGDVSQMFIDGASEAERYLTTPVPIQTIGLERDVTAISSGGYHTCAIQNGSAKCWGENDNGQLGDGSFVRSAIPVQVVGMTSGVTVVSAATLWSISFTCLVQTGKLSCWGMPEARGDD